MLKVVYFNHWFSSIRNVLEDIKIKHNNMIKIIVSSTNSNHTCKDIADKFIIESIGYDSYVDWVYNLCIENKVDIFFVKKHAKDIMKESEKFKLAGIKLICEEYDVLNSLDRKSSMYSLISDTYPFKYAIPYYRLFGKCIDAIKWLRSVKGTNNAYCFKLDSDEGGQSFREIIDDTITISSLSSTWVNKLTTEQIIRMIEDIEDIEDTDVNKLIFMEKLYEPELSIDCYDSKNGFIAICREKQMGRVQRIFYDETYYNICHLLKNKLKLQFPFNVQFRASTYDKDNKKIIDINPRLSGGVYQEVILGYNIAEICLLDALGLDDQYNIDKFKNFENKLVTHVEQAVLL